MNPHILHQDIAYFAQSFPLWEELRDKSFFITGATGLIGSIALKCLAEISRAKQLNIRLYACVRDRSKTTSCFAGYPEIQFIYSELEELPSTVAPVINYVIHLASPTASSYFTGNPVETIRAIVSGTEAVLEYVRHQKCTFLFVSSMEVYGVIPKRVVADESFMGYVNPMHPRSSYPMAKRMAENLCVSYCSEYNVDIRIARLSQTFGAGINTSESRVFAEFIKCALLGDDLILKTKGESAHPFCYTIDAICAFLYIILKGEKGKVYNVGNPDTFCSIHDLAEMICKLCETGSKVIICEDKNAPYPPSSILKLDMSRLMHLGWKPGFNLQSMLERLIAYMT